MRDASRIVMSLFFALSVVACDDAESSGPAEGAGGGAEGGGEPTGSRTDPIVFPAAFTSTVVARGDGVAADAEPVDLPLVAQALGLEVVGGVEHAFALECRDQPAGGLHRHAQHRAHFLA